MFYFRNCEQIEINRKNETGSLLLRERKEFRLKVITRSNCELQELLQNLLKFQFVDVIFSLFIHATMPF